MDGFNGAVSRRPRIPDMGPTSACSISVPPGWGGAPGWRRRSGSWTPTPKSQIQDAETLLFVDVDGVLNVGIRDGRRGPLDFGPRNVEKARTIRALASRHAADDLATADRLLAVHERDLTHGEDGTYSKLASSGWECSDVLIDRFADIVQACGEFCTPVLSSTWRLPKHVRLVNQLEAAVSQYLTEPFQFRERTVFGVETSPADRLNHIMNFIDARFAKNPTSRLRVVILDDLMCAPLGGFSCRGQPMDTCACVERHICSLGPSAGMVEAKLIHTYEEWKLPSGIDVQVGTGLTMEHYCTAMNYLTGESRCSYCKQKGAEQGVAAERHGARKSSKCTKDGSRASAGSPSASAESTGVIGLFLSMMGPRQ